MRPRAVPVRLPPPALAADDDVGVPAVVVDELMAQLPAEGLDAGDAEGAE
jgi:hypothetical protein